MTKKKTESTFPLLKLPTEIRVRICEYAVVGIEPVQIEERAPVPRSMLRSGKRIHVEDDDRVATSHSRLAIAFTYRQIYGEVAPIYYTNNWFVTEMDRKDMSQPQVLCFLDAIGPVNAQCISKVCLALRGDYDCDVSRIGVTQPEHCQMTPPRDPDRYEKYLDNYDHIFKHHALQYQQAVFPGNPRIVLSVQGTVKLEVQKVFPGEAILVTSAEGEEVLIDDPEGQDGLGLPGADLPTLPRN